MADVTKNGNAKAISQAGKSMMPKEKRQQAAARLLAAEETKRKKNGNMLAKLATRIPAHTNETKQHA